MLRFYFVIICVCSTLIACGEPSALQSRFMLYSGIFRTNSDVGGEPLRYRLFADSNEYSLMIDGPAKNIVWRSDIGQSKPTAVYGSYFSGIDNVLVVDADEGASSLRKIIFRINEYGAAITIFDGMSRFGFDIIDIDADLVPEIVVCDGGLMGTKDIKIYKWNGNQFIESNGYQSQELPSYKLIASP